MSSIDRVSANVAILVGLHHGSFLRRMVGIFVKKKLCLFDPVRGASQHSCLGI